MTIAKFEARPEVRQELLELAWMLVKWPCAEDGCLDFGGYRDIMGSDALLVVGRWIDQRTLE